MSEKKTETSDVVSFHPIHLTEYRSPEKINEYVRTAAPSTWIGIAALILIIVALFVWGFVGTLPVHCLMEGFGVSSTTSGNVKEKDRKVSTVICMVDPAKAAARDLNNKNASVVFRSGQRVSGKAFLLDPFPMSQAAIKEKLVSLNLGVEWIISQMEQYPFMFLVEVQLEREMDFTYHGELAEVSVITSEVRPIRFLMGGKN